MRPPSCAPHPDPNFPQLPLSPTTSFYDDSRQNWSVRFDEERHAIDFAKQVAVAKFNSAVAHSPQLVVQTLVPSEDNEAKAIAAGDSLEIKYTGWLYANDSIGTV